MIVGVLCGSGGYTTARAEEEGESAAGAGVIAHNWQPCAPGGGQPAPRTGEAGAKAWPSHVGPLRPEAVHCGLVSCNGNGGAQDAGRQLPPPTSPPRLRLHLVRR